MRAIEIAGYGGPQVLRETSRPDPVPPAGTNGTTRARGGDRPSTPSSARPGFAC